MPTWDVGEPAMPDDDRADLICATAADVASRDGDLEEALRRLIPLATGRLDLVELALDDCRSELADHPDDPVRRRATHLLELAVATRVFD